MYSQASNFHWIEVRSFLPFSIFAQIPPVRETAGGAQAHRTHFNVPSGFISHSVINYSLLKAVGRSVRRFVGRRTSDVGLPSARFRPVINRQRIRTKSQSVVRRDNRILDRKKHIKDTFSLFLSLSLSLSQTLTLLHLQQPLAFHHSYLNLQTQVVSFLNCIHSITKLQSSKFLQIFKALYIGQGMHAIFMLAMFKRETTTIGMGEF